MCATQGCWFTRYVSCCVSASSAVGADGDEDVMRLSKDECCHHCSSACVHRGRHDTDDVTSSFLSKCRRRSDHERGHSNSRKVLNAARSSTGLDDDNKSTVPLFTAALCNDDVGNSELMTGLEYVCCCERCDSVSGWFLATVPATSAVDQQARRQAQTSLRLQNYLVASRNTFEGCRGPLKSEGSSGGSESTVDVEMSVSLISSCDINGVDLLSGHRLKKDVDNQLVDKQYNELVGCFRPPPNRTIGHIYLATAATPVGKLHQDDVQCCRHHKAPTAGCRCCQRVDDDDHVSPSCCIFQRRRRTPNGLSSGDHHCGGNKR